MSSEKVAIILAEDQTIVREGLRAILSTTESLEIVDEAEDGLEAIRQAEMHQPDLIILDLAMPRVSGLSAIRDIKRVAADTKILALTFHKSEEYILEAFQAGADGYCLKNDDKAVLMIAIKSVLDGKRYISPAISDKILNGYLDSRKTFVADPSWDQLTKREREIIKLVAEGYTSPEIADFLCISQKTVDKHRANIMGKLDLHSAAALTAYAVERGVVGKYSDDRT